MFEVRIHGRGGQGVVTAAELLAAAAFAEGRSAQAFPSFGSERTGAPVVAFCRIAERPIRLREPILRPDAVIVQDATLLRQTDVLAGLADGGLVLVNSTRAEAELGLSDHGGRVIVVPASRLAREYLGRPLPNAALLGGFAALCGLISLESVTAAIRARFPGPVAEANTAAAAAAYDLVRAHRKERARA
ncbi:2-oxoacid:acceptor oxidoreductase family protein [Phytohabitans suffuscus]|uniref:Pyruvate ferredoxin oxidoreductase subunit gamma n=1 Tax=Phytohabitans suffuscus TaxID=624315 RepID=A0A6F8YU13_9ACTN|nr:2-oxoacid:acceptor oxidoreductase family protein [Phytohabitans suffuscus]BCB89559.1 pyruvate ferredoxin oxidoreductase subunit gamma [Phytohabitans suffuscus]